MKEQVTQLVTGLEKKAAEDPKTAETMEEVAGNFKTLAQQAAEPKPIKSVLQVTGQGLVDAAKTVAEMIGPVNAAVKGVLALFGVVLP